MTKDELAFLEDYIDRLLIFNPAEGSFVWRLSQGSKKAGSNAGYLRPDGYHEVRIVNKKYLMHRLVWLMINDEFPEFIIDHINRVRSDNRPENLRRATVAQNQWNRPRNVSNTSGYKGVTFDKRYKSWRAAIRANGVRYHLGTFPSAEAAAQAYKRAATVLHGEFSHV